MLAANYDGEFEGKLLGRLKLVVEPTGSAAPLQREAARGDHRVVVLIGGSNIDPATFCALTANQSDTPPFVFCRQRRADTQRGRQRIDDATASV